MTVSSKDLGSPDDTKTFDHGKSQVAKIGSFTMSRNTFEPGWRWSDSIKPLVNTDSCQVHHVGYLLQGRLGVATEDGSEAEIGPGEAYEIQPGHDGWVVGDEAVITVEFWRTDWIDARGS